MPMILVLQNSEILPGVIYTTPLFQIAIQECYFMNLNQRPIKTWSLLTQVRIILMNGKEMITIISIWANIKKVYYGNTKEDAANIGFRDDFIYEYIKNLNTNSQDNTLKLENIGREETIKVFEEFKNKSDKTIY